MPYLVPLNNDEPFKKVFSDKEIAKAFLEDMLDVTIQDIELVETDHKITNAASIVRFDFRCKIDDEEVVIEMQNDYFDYLIKRFYLYHCLNTGLQLEFIQDRVAISVTGKEVVTKRYEELRPAITIIWMAQSNLGFKEDLMEFNMHPKMIKRLSTEYMEPDELRKMMGDEAYFAAKQRYAEDIERDRRAQIYDQYHMLFGEELRAERLVERHKLTAASQAFYDMQRKLTAEKEKLERQLKAKEASILKQEALAQKVEKAKNEKAALLKAEREKNRKEKAALLKVEKEKQKQELQNRLKLVRKLVDKGHSVDAIADLLEVSLAQVQTWIQML